MSASNKVSSLVCATKYNRLEGLLQTAVIHPATLPTIFHAQSSSPGGILINQGKKSIRVVLLDVSSPPGSNVLFQVAPRKSKYRVFLPSARCWKIDSVIYFQHVRALQADVIASREKHLT